MTIEEIKELRPSDIHAHMGSSVAAHTIWEIANKNGIKLGTKDYRTFIDAMSVKSKMEHSVYLNKFHLTQMVQSSPDAMETCVYEAISSAYRKSNLKSIELRFNVLLRNNNNYYDLDNLIFRSCVGLQRAMMVYPDIKAGIIMEANRDSTYDQSMIIVNKAIKFMYMGIVGIDVSGPNPQNFNIEKFSDMYNMGKEAGLMSTFHTGEMTGCDEIEWILDNLKVNRIGHGVRCVESVETMKKMADYGICLEICPTSNIKLGVVKDLESMGDVLDKLDKFNIDYTINSDGPLFLGNTVIDELKMLYDNKMLPAKRLDKIMRNYDRYSFLS